MKHIALVVGATGMAGSNLADQLAAKGWDVYGLSHSQKNKNKSVKTITADLLDVGELTEALKDIHPTHLFFTT